MLHNKELTMSNHLQTNRGVVRTKVSFYQKYVSAVGITQATSARLQVGAAGGDKRMLKYHAISGSSIIAPSIAIPLGLLFIMPLIFITIFVTRRIRKKGNLHVIQKQKQSALRYDL